MGAAVTGREPIAVVGVGCRFPGAVDTFEYWHLLAEARDAVREAPRHRFDPAAFYDPDPAKPGKSMSKWGGYLDSVDEFDWRAFRISPREAKFMDPQHRLLLEVSWEAFEDAGLLFEELAGSRTSVFVGIMWPDYAKLASRDYTKLEGYNANGNSFAYSANRISYYFDLKGPSVALDVQCASSLTAAHLACQSLWSGDADIALASGVNLIISPDTNIAMSKASILSPEGRCKTWDAAADGFVRGEGAGVAVLKPLSQAMADGDRVYAVIRSTVAHHGGKTDWIMAPSREGQERMLREAYELAGIDPRTVDYIELHGTGTKVGDPIEAAALAAVVAEGRPEGSVCKVGSVKTNIGHLDSASGMAGLIKTAMALHRRQIPASLHFHEPNPALPLDHLQVVTELEPWPDSDHEPVAGVSGLSFGGGHSHVVLTASPDGVAAAAAAGRPPARPYVLPLSAKSDDALRLLARSFADFLRRERVDLFDVCHTAALRRTHHDVRAAVVARTREELIERLEALAADEPRPGVHMGKREAEPPRPVFVFAGQGTPWWASGRELLALEPVFRREVAACDQRMRPHARWSLVDELTRAVESSRLARTAVAQPATFALQMGLAALWKSWGVEPAAVVGHSVGEVAAVTVAGAIEPADAARLAVFRGKLMSDAPTHPAMAAVLLPLAETEALIEDFGPKAAVVADNAPSATLVSGDEASIAKLLARCEAQGVYATPIPEHDVFHRAPKAYGDALVDWLGDFPTGEPGTPVFFTATADRFDVGYWGRQMASRVEFRTAVEAAVDEGFTTFVELGAHPVLAGPVTECLRGRETEGTVLPSLRRGEAEQATMLDSAAQLWVAGHPLRWENVLAGPGHMVSLPTHPWIRERLWIDVGDLSALPAAGSATTSGHPLLGAHLRLAVSGQHVWESVVDRAVLRWLDDHLVGGVAVLAGASYVEMVTSAVEEAFGWSGCVLRDIDLGKALVLPENMPRRVQLVMAPVDGETLSFQVLSRPSEASDGEPWTLHVKGTVAPLPEDTAVAPADLDEVRRPLHEEVSGAACYRRFEAQGEHYGPTFQGIAKLWRRDGEVLAQMRAPTPIVSDVPRFRFHPAFLDACMHALVMAEGGEEGGSGFMPTRIDEVVVTGRLDADAWSHVRLAERDEVPTGTIDADIAVLDKAGAPTMRIRGLHLQFLDETALKAPLAERWYYEMSWEPFERATSSDGGRVEGTWVVVGEPTGVADALAARLRADGADVSVVAPGDALPDGATGVVHLGSLASRGIGEMTVAELDEVQTLGCGGALAAVKALGSRAARLVLVTRGAQATRLGEGADASQASLWGFGRSLAQERPELWGGLVDLDPSLDAEAAAAADALHAHLVASDGEDQVAVRGDQWLAARLVRTRVLPTASKPHWRPDAAYLITGGLGDLGLGVARWLAEHGARRLVLMGRTPLPPRSEWRDLDPDSAMAARTEAVRAIEALGVSVHLAACDVGDEASMRAFLDDYEAEGWPPIRGVIHSAGVAPFEAVEQMTLDGLHGVLRSKVAGSLVLHNVLPDLETFVLFSSASAVLSSPRLAHYAAGNAFEDAFAHFRHALGLPVLSVDWGPWAEVGMATRTGTGGPAALRGMHLIPLEEGFDAMDRLLVSGRPNVAVLPVEWDEWRESYRAMAAAPILRHVIGEREPAAEGVGAGDGDDTGAAAPSTSLLLLPPEERAAVAGPRVIEQLCAVLRVTAEQLAGDQSLAELGFDSLMAMEARTRIAGATGIDLSILEILGAATAEQLVDVVLGKLDQLGEQVIVLPDETPAASPVAPASAADGGLGWVVDLLTDDEVDALLAELEGAS